MCLNLCISKNFQRVFRKPLKDRRIPTNIDINERLWTGRL